MNTIGKESKHGQFWQPIIDMDHGHFPNPWKASDWEDLNFTHHSLYSVSLGAELLGFSLFQTLNAEPVAHLLKICLKPSHRKTGAAIELWTAVKLSLRESGYQAVYLEVAVNNTQAIGFYQKVGFRDLRVIRGYYSNGDDALVMDLTL